MRFKQDISGLLGVYMAVLVVLTSAGVSWPTYAQSALVRHAPLSPGERREATLDTASVHLWTMPLEAGQFVQVDIAQHGIDLVMRVVDPSGVPKGFFDNPTGAAVIQQARWIADSDGLWQLQIMTFGDVPSGRYALTWQVQRPAQALDREIVRLDSFYLDLAALYAANRYEEAGTLLVRMRDIAERALGPGHPDVARVLNTQAAFFMNRGRYDEALTLLHHARTIQEQALGPAHPDVAMTLDNLAAYHYAQGNEAEVEPLYRQALALREQALGDDHLLVAGSLSTLAEWYHAQGRYDEAEPLYRRALAIGERLLEPGDESVMDDYNHLAQLYAVQQRYHEADSLFTLVLRRREEALGPSHLRVGNTLVNLAYVYVEQARYDEAEPLYLRALQIQQSTLDPAHPDLPTTLNNLALLYHEQGRYDEAESFYNQALTLLEQRQEAQPAEVSKTLNNLALLYVDQGRYDEAESLYQRALQLQRTTLGSDHPDVATTLNNLALLYHEQGRYGAIEPLYRRSLAIVERVHGLDHLEYATMLSNLALLLVEMGRYEEARPQLERALDLKTLRLGSEHPSVGTSLVNLAALHEAQGRYAEAELLYRQALDLMERARGPDHAEVAGILENIARLYTHQRRYPEAVALFKRALDVRRVQGTEHPGVALPLNGLAVVYQYQDRFAEAEPLLKEALAIQEHHGGRETVSYVTGLNNLAMVYAAQQRYDEATARFEEALGIYEQALGTDHPALTHTLVGLAENRLEIGQPAAALAALIQALQIFDATPGYYPTWHIKAYTVRARLHREKGQFDEALLDLEEALRLVEDVRPQVGGGEQTRADFFRGYARYFDDIVAWHLEAGDVARAFEYAERGRARVLLDQLAAGKIDLRARLSAEQRTDLEARETEAQARLAEYQQRITLLRARTDLSEAERLDRLAVLNDSLARADQAYRQVYQDIKNASDLWRSYITSGGQPVDLARVQRRLVPSQGLMLLYQVGAEGSSLFVIPPRGQDVIVFPLTITEEQAARLKIPVGPLTSGTLRRGLGFADDEAVPEAMGLIRQMATRGLQSARARGAASPTAMLHAFWQILVPEALWPRLKAASEVVLIPDEALHYLPFEALVVEPDGEAPRYWLDEGPPLRYAPSATVLFNVADAAAGRRVPVGKASLLSLSAPIFDPTLVTQAVEERTATNTPTRDRYTRLGGSFAPLPGTAQETDAIQAAFGDEATYAVAPLQGLDATEANLRQMVEGKRFLHLATHGLVDARRDALFASLILTPPPGETDDLANDGFLQLHEIYDLPLDTAELAVLSACQSNIGPHMEGEGVFALSRGFLAAGVRRVIASQWSVDDASTAALMGAFFEAVVEAQRAGRPVDYTRALWEARQQVRNNASWSDPYYWAPFILTGLQ